MRQHAALWVSGLTLLATSLAGCVGEFSGTTGKGTVFFCVQDDPTVNFNGVFVNFGNIQINQNTSGNNTINDNDTTGGDTTATTVATDSMTSPTDGSQNTTNGTEPTEATTSTETTTDAVTETTTAANETMSQDSPGSVQTISVDDIDCGRVDAEGSFDGLFRGQVGGPYDDTPGGQQGEECAPENPGCVADERRGQSDSTCDPDQGFGNDAKCETVDVEAGDVDVLQFKDRKAAFLGQGELEPGTVQRMCLTVEDVRVVTNDGREVDAEIQNGDICLDGPVEIREGQSTLVVFKVDVENSFVDSGDDRIVFSPVINVHAAAPVATTITVEETVTQTAVASSTNTTTETTNATEGTEATSAYPTETMATSTTTTATNETATATPTSTTEANQTTTASPTPTTTGP